MRNRNYDYIGGFVDYLKEIIRIIINVFDKIKGKDVEWDF